MSVAKKILDTDHALGRVVRTSRTLTQPSEQPWEVATPILHMGKESQRGIDLSRGHTASKRQSPNSPGVGTKQECSLLPSPTRFEKKKKKKKAQFLLLLQVRCVTLRLDRPLWGSPPIFRE